LKLLDLDLDLDIVIDLDMTTQDLSRIIQTKQRAIEQMEHELVRINNEKTVLVQQTKQLLVMDRKLKEEINDIKDSINVLDTESKEIQDQVEITRHKNQETIKMIQSLKNDMLDLRKLESLRGDSFQQDMTKVIIDVLSVMDDGGLTGGMKETLERLKEPDGPLEVDLEEESKEDAGDFMERVLQEMDMSIDLKGLAGDIPEDH